MHVKELAENYRPLSVLPVVAKVFEAIVHTQLFVYILPLELSLNRNEIVGTTLIDLSKAFGSIDHNLFVAKLEAYGIRSNEKEWFLNYLTDRQQRVVVGGAKSTWSDGERSSTGVHFGSFAFYNFYE